MVWEEAWIELPQYDRYLLYHVDTVSVARDLEAAHITLGDEKLNYLGLSYRTLLGAQCAEFFPNKVRTMVLDGDVDHPQSEISNIVTEVLTFENEFNLFATWCSKSGSYASYQKGCSSLTRQSSRTSRQGSHPCSKLGRHHLLKRHHL